MEKYNHLQSLLRTSFYQAVFEKFETIQAVVLDYKKDSSLVSFERLKEEIEAFRKEDQAFAISFFDTYCDGIGLDSYEEIMEMLDEIMLNL
jgi:hypothetical protein